MFFEALSARNTRILFVSIAVVTPVGFLIGLPWLQHSLSGELLWFCTGLATTVTVIAGYAAAIVRDQQQDEWNRSKARFANQWGALAGASLIALLLAIPPFHEGVFAIALQLTADGKLDKELAVLIFFLGFVSLVFAQLICTFLLGRIWRWRMSRPDS